MSLLLTKLSKLNAFLALYESACLLSSLSGKTIFQHVLEELDVNLKYDWPELSFCSGGCIVVSNHPTGPLDGVLIGAFLDQCRVRYKIVANSLLSKLDQLHDKFIFVCVEPKGSRDTKANALSLREVIAFIESGGCCVIFPSGEVEGFNLLRWSVAIGFLARTVRCRVVPIYINGECSLTFRIAMLFGHRCRIFCLPRQLFVKKHKTIRLTIGSSIEAWRMRGYLTNEQMTLFIRNKVAALKHE
jgi:putative hemolysin